MVVDHTSEINAKKVKDANPTQDKFYPKLHVKRIANA